MTSEFVKLPKWFKDAFLKWCEEPLESKLFLADLVRNTFIKTYPSREINTKYLDSLTQKVKEYLIIIELENKVKEQSRRIEVFKDAILKQEITHAKLQEEVCQSIQTIMQNRKTRKRKSKSNKDKLEEPVEKKLIIENGEQNTQWAVATLEEMQHNNLFLNFIELSDLKPLSVPMGCKRKLVRAAASSSSPPSVLKPEWVTHAGPFLQRKRGKIHARDNCAGCHVPGVNILSTVSFIPSNDNAKKACGFCFRM
jgi:hypothetical protein